MKITSLYLLLLLAISCSTTSSDKSSNSVTGSGSINGAGGINGIKPLVGNYRREEQFDFGQYSEKYITKMSFLPNNKYKCYITTIFNGKKEINGVIKDFNNEIAIERESAGIFSQSKDFIIVNTSGQEIDKSGYNELFVLDEIFAREKQPAFGSDEWVTEPDFDDLNYMIAKEDEYTLTFIKVFLVENKVFRIQGEMDSIDEAVAEGRGEIYFKE